MRRLGYFFLLCGLVNSAAWGESAHKNQQYVVIKCRAVSCGGSSSSVTRRAKPEVKLGTFKSFPHSGLDAAKDEVKLGTFKSPTTHAGIRAANYEVRVGTFKPFPSMSPHMLLLQARQREKSEKPGMLVVKTDAFPLPNFVVQR
jgi:hypothetical protein